MIGLAYLQLGDFAQALTAGQAAVTHGPERGMGPPHLLASRWSGSAAPASAPSRPRIEAARLAPEAAAAHIVLASALQATGDNRGAVAAAPPRHRARPARRRRPLHARRDHVRAGPPRRRDPRLRARARAGPGGRRHAQQPRRRPPARPSAHRDRRAVRGRRAAGPAPGRRPPQPPPHRPGGPQLRVPARQHGRARVSPAILDVQRAGVGPLPAARGGGASRSSARSRSEG